MNKKKEVKKLRKQIEKTLGWYLRNPDTTLGEAERACFRLHQAIEETYRNNFKDNGRPYSSKPIFVPSETKIDRQGTSQAVNEKITGQVLGEHTKVANACREHERKAIRRQETLNKAIQKSLKDGIPKEIYVDTLPSNN